MMTTIAAAQHVSTEMTTLPSPVDRATRISAVLFDLDGTLYRQRPLRLRMALALAMSTLTAPLGAATRWRVLQAFRRAQETMRAGGAPASLQAQIAAASAQTGVTEPLVQDLVEEWMLQRPLEYLRRYLAEGTVALLDFLDARGIPAGLLSDYPAAGKLRALGLEGRFSPVLCAMDPEIQAFKPNPRGFMAACARWRLEPSQVLYVGDRVEVDATGAAAAGMPCVIVGASLSSNHIPAGTVFLPTLERLCRVLADGR